MSLYSFPDQTIPESEKDEAWYLKHNTNYGDVTAVQQYADQRSLMAKYYRAYYGEMNDEELELTKAITCPHGIDLGQEYVVYPLIRSKIEQIISDYFKRSFKKKIYAVDEESKSSKLDAKFDMIAEEIMREVQEDLKGQMGLELETGNPNMELPPDIEMFFEEGFQTAAESTGQAIVDFLLYAQKNIKKLAQICLDYFITDRTHCSIDIDKNHISLRPVHSMDVFADLNPYQDVQDDHDFVFESYWLSENEIYNKLDLTEEKKEMVRLKFANIGMPGDQNISSDKDELTVAYKDGVWYQTDNKINRIRLVYGRWKSKKVINYKKSEDRHGNFHWKRLPKNYKVKNREKKMIKTISPDVIRYAVSIGHDCLLEYGIDEYRITSKDDMFSTKMDFVSLIRENYSGSSTIKSIAAILYPLQKMASEILFELRYALKKAGNDRVLIYDTSQTPKELNNGSIKNALKTVNHFIKSDAIMYINGQQKGTRGNFNQFGSYDISQTKGIKILIDSLAIIEQLADKFTSIAPERGGDVPKNQTATATEVAIGGSASKNEIFFKPLDNLFATLVERMLQKAKLFYDENQIIQYVIGDNKTKFLRIYKEFFDADLGCYFGDPGKDLQLQQMIDQAAQMAMQSANTPEVILGLIEVMEGDTASEKKKLFQEMLDHIEKIRQENIEAQNKQAEEATKQAALKEDRNDKRHQEQMANNIEVAKIYANNKAYSDNLKAQSAKEVQRLADESKERIAANQKEKEPETA